MVNLVKAVTPELLKRLIPFKPMSQLVLRSAAYVLEPFNFVFQGHIIALLGLTQLKGIFLE